jgi:hypothetical protein
MSWTFFTPGQDIVQTYRKNTPKTVNTTVTATDLLNAEITIAANAMRATSFCQITAFGDWLQNSGGLSAPPRFQLVLGGTTIIDTGALSATVVASATRGLWRISALIAAANSTGAQVTSWEHGVASGAITYTAAGTNIALFTTGQGNYTTVPAHSNTSNSDGGQFEGKGYNVTSLDMTSSKTLVLNVINGSSSASYETSLKAALVEII